MEKEFLTPEEAAELLSVNPQTVYRNMRAGKLPGAKVGTSWRIPRLALDEYMRTGTWYGQGGMQEGRWRVQEDYGFNDRGNQARWGWVVKLATARGELNPVFKENTGSWDPDSGIRKQAMEVALRHAVMAHLNLLLMEIQITKQRVAVLEKEGRNPDAKNRDLERLKTSGAEKVVEETLAWLNQQGQGHGGSTTYRVVTDDHGLPKVESSYVDYSD